MLYVLPAQLIELEYGVFHIDVFISLQPAAAVVGNDGLQIIVQLPQDLPVIVSQLSVLAQLDAVLQQPDQKAVFLLQQIAVFAAKLRLFQQGCVLVHMGSDLVKIVIVKGRELAEIQIVIRVVNLIVVRRMPLPLYQ